MEILRIIIVTYFSEINKYKQLFDLWKNKINKNKYQKRILYFDMRIQPKWMNVIINIQRMIQNHL